MKTRSCQKQTDYIQLLIRLSGYMLVLQCFGSSSQTGRSTEMPLLHILFSRNYRFVLKFEQQLKDNSLSRAVSQQICDSSARHLSAVYFWTDSDYSGGIQLRLICLTGVYTFQIFLFCILFWLVLNRNVSAFDSSLTVCCCRGRQTRCCIQAPDGALQCRSVICG